MAVITVTTDDELIKAGTIVQDGDTIDLAPITFHAALGFRRDRVTVTCSQGRTILDGTNAKQLPTYYPSPLGNRPYTGMNGKGAIVFQGYDCEFRNLEIRNWHNSDRSSSGILQLCTKPNPIAGQPPIRVGGSFYVAPTVEIHHNDDGIRTTCTEPDLTNDSSPWQGPGDETMNPYVWSEAHVHHNGAGDGQSHNYYISRNQLFVCLGPCHDAVVGHDIKSRARVTIIANNSAIDGEVKNATGAWVSTASRQISQDGGVLIVQGFDAFKSLSASSPANMIDYGLQRDPDGISEVWITGNRLQTDIHHQGSFIRIRNLLPDGTFKPIGGRIANNVLAYKEYGDTGDYTTVKPDGSSGPIVAPASIQISNNTVVEVGTNPAMPALGDAPTRQNVKEWVAALRGPSATPIPGFEPEEDPVTIAALTADLAKAQAALADAQAQLATAQTDEDALTQQRDAATAEVARLKGILADIATRAQAA